MTHNPAADSVLDDRVEMQMIMRRVILMALVLAASASAGAQNQGWLIPPGARPYELTMGPEDRGT
jgi:hypothetical protein